ncbi:MAG TPA: ATP-binding protein [Amycolatopsis sp.]|uniref:ATP-binding protein n=1 Tax=Amycolatopsis sp. TaxID=37632 RepID=UPI002B498D58|nr:ATP-binding protein [Amycolatopsis sp.]HKS44899.1 ATP-binding protein [Amycolatopsis sp.]
MNTEASLLHVLDRLVWLERRIRAAVAARRAADPHPDDPFRGLYLSEEAIDALLEARREPFASFTETAPDGRLGRLAATVPLTDLDVELLLVALAPDVDSRFEQFYGYLNDDVTRRRATIGLALRLCGVPEASAAGRARLDPGAPLIAAGLLRVDELERPFLSRGLRVPDRVVGHLLGDDRLDPALTDFAQPVTTTVEMPHADRLARALRDAVRLVYLRERPGGGAVDLATAALARAGFSTLAAEEAWLRTGPDGAETTRALLREALLRGAGVVLGPVGELGSGRGPGAGSSEGRAGPPLTGLSHPAVPVILYGAGLWDPRWSSTPPLQHDAPLLPIPIRAELWRVNLGGRLAPGTDPADATAHFMLGPGQIRAAAAAAKMSAAAAGERIGVEHLRAGARSQNAAGLQRLARRIEPAVGWPDLVLPEGVLTQLRELATRARFRDRVLDEWRMRPGGGRGRGVTGLFAGDSGTGKTMSAEVIASSLGLDLYTVNLATVVDKYVGETEKNLERIFTEAAGINGVLLFDEADAIFGKRSEVRDAHDRYANIESAYLLQRMETFDGIAILATNLRANLDEAFTRRLDVIVDFPLPDSANRRRLWDQCLGNRLPRADDLDLDFLATRFELAGGHIRSAAVTAAYLSAEAARPLAMIDLVGAVAREYRKLGRLCLEREFGHYLPLVA